MVKIAELEQEIERFVFSMSVSQCHCAFVCVRVCLCV